SIYAIFYNDVFHLSVFKRGMIAAGTEPLQIVGALIGVRFIGRLMARDAGLVLKLQAIVGVVTAVLIVGFALAPNLPVAIAMNVLLVVPLAILVPGIYFV